MSVAPLIGVVGVDAAGMAPSVDSYARQGWPDTTPSYAVREYPDLLIAAGDAVRLLALARDPRRHAFLLRVTGSDYAAQAEIAAAQRLVASQDAPDLQALVELAVYRNAMSLRNQCLPFVLPGVWARLGRLDHAEALARAITYPDARAAALEDISTAAAKAGDADRASRLATEAEALAGTITDVNRRGQALDALASAAAQAGDLDRAEALARTIADDGDQAWALAELATAAAQADDLDRASRLAADAEALARAITRPAQQARTLAE